MPARSLTDERRGRITFGAADKSADCAHETNHPSDIGC
jgi:hypothetical protein